MAQSGRKSRRMDGRVKLLIASDLHGSAKYTKILESLLELQKPEKLVLLGDLLYHGPRNPLPEEYDPKQVIEILNRHKEQILAVRGNCESEVDQMVLKFPIMAEYAVLFVDGVTVYATHGHHVEEGNLPLQNGTILLSGHTHIGREEIENKIVHLNPGSMSLPKDGEHSYMVYENKMFTRYNLEGKVLGTWKI